MALRAGSDADHAHFSTATGWQVSLEEARIGIAAMYAFAPASDKQGALAWLERCCVSVAHAHGGLDAETGRRVLAELTEPVSVDLLANGALSLRPLEAETGSLDGLKIELTKSSDAAAALHGGSVYVHGEATKDERSVEFAATVVLGDDDKSRTIELLNLRNTLERDATFELRIDPSVWFANCEFDRLPANDDGPVVSLPPDNQVGRALVIGSRSPDAFSFALGEGEWS